MFGEILRYSIAAAHEYVPYVPLVVGSYRIGYGKVEAYIFSRLATTESLRKAKEISKKFFNTPQQFFQVHGSLLAISGFCQIFYWTQETAIFYTTFSTPTLWTGGCITFLLAQIASLLYSVNLYIVAQELHSTDPELAKKIYCQAKWGVAYSLAAIIASTAALLSASTFIAFLLAGIASITGCLKVLRDWQLN